MWVLLRDITVRAILKKRQERIMSQAAERKKREQRWVKIYEVVFRELEIRRVMPTSTLLAIEITDAIVALEAQPDNYRVDPEQIAHDESVERAAVRASRNVSGAE